MKSKFNLMKQFPLIIAGLMFISSCSTYNKVACPDLSNNRSYSKKYTANDHVKKNLHKSQAVKRNNYYAFRIYNGPKPKARNTKDYTINKDKSYIAELSQIKSIPGITEFQVPAAKDEKFNLIASSHNSKANESSVPSVPDIKNSNNSYPVASQDMSNLTKKEQRKILKPYKKELKSAVRSYAYAMSGQQAKPAMGFAIASVVCGLVGLFVFGIILGTLALIFGAIALKRIRNNPGTPGRGLAIAGLILGLVDVVLLLILIAAYGATLSAL
jgi:uncharacterized membrane protein